MYEIKDPVAFFKDQPDLHYPNPFTSRKKKKSGDLLKEFNETARNRYRGLLQQVTEDTARETAVATFDIKLDGPKPKPRHTMPPLLKEKSGFRFVGKLRHKVINPKMDDWKYEKVKLPFVKQAGVSWTRAVHYQK